MFIWPVWKFWTFSPIGWVLAIVWNFCEYFRITMPKGELTFGIICGCKSQKIT